MTKSVIFSENVVEFWVQKGHSLFVPSGKVRHSAVERENFRH